MKHRTCPILEMETVCSLQTAPFPVILGGEGFEPSKLSQQIYSLPPLAARESTQTLQESHLNLQNRTAYLHNLSFEKSIRMASPYSCISSAFLHRKEVIQPHLPIRLPCYDFTPVTGFTFGDSPLCRLGHRLRALPTPMV